VFGKKGLFRQGMMDLLVWLNTPADGSRHSTTLGKVRDGDKEQHHRLAKLTKKYHTGGYLPITCRVLSADLKKMLVSVAVSVQRVSNNFGSISGFFWAPETIL
jgi:hypothetical protein